MEELIAENKRLTKELKKLQLENEELRMQQITQRNRLRDFQKVIDLYLGDMQ